MKLFHVTLLVPHPVYNLYIYYSICFNVKHIFTPTSFFKFTPVFFLNTGCVCVCVAAVLTCTLCASHLFVLGSGYC